MLLKVSGGAAFQVMISFVIIASLQSVAPIVVGLPFLEKEPHKFECLKNNSWESCSHHDICSNKLSKDQYRAVKTDSEYLVNLVESMDLLCTPHFKVGLIGSCYFIGIIITILPVPMLSDMYGRKTIYLASLVVCVLA